MSRGNKNNQHVVHCEGRWAVRGELNTRATSIHSTKRKAIEAASIIARNQGSEIIIHRRDGHVIERSSFPPILSPKGSGNIDRERIRAAIKALIRKKNNHRAGSSFEPAA